MSPPLAYAIPTDAPPGLHLAPSDDAHRADPRGSPLSSPQRAAALVLIAVALAILGPDDTPAPAEPPDTRPSLPGRLTGA
jgi:hypothetical protein